jgi:hypothetical protein
MLIISKFWFDLNCVDCFQVLIWFELCWLFPSFDLIWIELCWLFPCVEFFQTLLFNLMFSIALKCVDYFQGLNSFDCIHTNIFPFSKSISSFLPSQSYVLVWRLHVIWFNLHFTFIFLINRVLKNLCSIYENVGAIVMFSIVEIRCNLTKLSHLYISFENKRFAHGFKKMFSE